MRKLLFMAIILILCFSTVYAEKQKIGLIGIKKKDSGSSYVTKMITKVDFKSILKKNDKYELEDQKKISKVASSLGLVDMDVVSNDDVLPLIDEFSLDYVIWGTVSSKSKNEFRASFRIYSSQTRTLEVQDLVLVKNSKERQNTIKSQIIDKLHEFSVGEIEKDKKFAAEAFYTKNYMKAKQLYNKIIKIEPSYITGYEVLGVIEDQLQNYNEAIQHYTDALKYTDDKKLFYRKIVNSHIKNENYEDAAEVLQQIANEYNDSQDWIALCQLYINDYKSGGDLVEIQDIIDTLKDAYERDNSSVEINALLGLTYYDENQYELAIPYLEYASSNSEDEELEKKLANAYLKTNKLDSAIENYKELIKKDPLKEKNYVNLSKAYRTIKKYDLACKTLEDLIKISPKNTNNINRLAEAHLNARNYDKVRENINKSLKLEPDQYKPYMIKADMEYQLGSFEYQKYVKLDEESKKGGIYGEEADRIIAKRDKIKKQANNLFLNAKSNYKKANSMSPTNSVKLTIKNRLNTLNEVIKATESDDF